MEVLKRFFRPQQKLSKVEQPFTAKKLFDRFDVFYICFDEPNRHENWKQIQEVLPKAQKVEGVVGFDRALKTCARKSKTLFFFVIDGDNILLPDKFNEPFSIEDVRDDWVLSWSSLNKINSLAYGNGGLKLWPQKVALKIQSHEGAAKKDDQTDYCFIADYYLVDSFVTETVVNSTFKQAFRAGFREGVKMSLAWGKQVPLNKENFEKTLGRQNRLRLKVWCEMGADVPNGYWAILGARLGLKKNTINNFDYKVINSYDWIDSCLEGDVLSPLALSLKEFGSQEFDQQKLIPLIEAVGVDINQHLPLDLKLYSSDESKRFKESFKNPPRSGLLSSKKTI